MRLRIELEDGDTLCWVSEEFDSEDGLEMTSWLMAAIQSKMPRPKEKGKKSVKNEHCPSKELFDQGLAVAVYDCRSGLQTFRCWNEELTIPFMSVPQTAYKGWPCVAKWVDVKNYDRPLQ